MAYSLSELSSKYETLWDQQDELFCEFTSLKNRQNVVEYSNAQLIKMEKNMKEIECRTHNLNLKMGKICDLLQNLTDKRNRYNYYTNLGLTIIILCICLIIIINCYT